MWTVSQITCLGVLSGISVTDIYYRKIPVESLILGNVGAVAYQIHRVYCMEADVWLIAGGVGIGLLFLLLSRVTKEGIGYGDSWGILILGIYLGLWELLEVLAGTFLLLAATSMAVLCIKKMSRKYALPFYPFLTAGYLARIMVG